MDSQEFRKFDTDLSSISNFMNSNQSLQWANKTKFFKTLGLGLEKSLFFESFRHPSAPQFYQGLSLIGAGECECPLPRTQRLQNGLVDKIKLFCFNPIPLAEGFHHVLRTWGSLPNYPFPRFFRPACPSSEPFSFCGPSAILPCHPKNASAAVFGVMDLMTSTIWNWRCVPN